MKQLKMVFVLFGFLSAFMLNGYSFGDEQSQPQENNLITLFSINGKYAIIDQDKNTIAVTLPAGTDVTNLIPSFTTTGASVTVNGVTQFSGTTINNFTTSLPYLVTAADGNPENSKLYKVMVNFDQPK